MSKVPAITLRIIGILCIIFCIWGLLYNAITFFSFIGKSVTNNAPFSNFPHFRKVYFPMLIVSTSFFAALFVAGIEFMRLKTWHRYLFCCLFVVEVVYFFSIAFSCGVLYSFCQNSDVPGSVLAAASVANGGLLSHFIILFPLWAPLLVFWAHKKANNAPSCDVPTISVI